MHRQNADSMHQKNNYRPDIDGLRAIAVLAVIANHTDSRLAPSGFLGVDIFFAISGFVITASLIKRGNSRLKAMLLPFYARRIKRLIPALLTCILITSLFISLLSASPSASLWSGIWATFGLSNIYFYQAQTDYFSTGSELSPFLHTWSLGVEEQFYLVYPLIFWFSTQRQKLTRILLGSLALGLACTMTLSKLYAGSALAFFPGQLLDMGTTPFLILTPVIAYLFLSFAGSRADPWWKIYGHLRLTIGTISAISLLAFIVFTHEHSDAAYFLTVNRFWELGAGCLLALSIYRNNPRDSQALKESAFPGRGWLSLASMAAMISCFFLPVDWKLATTPLTVIFTLLVIGTTTADRPASEFVTALLSNRIMLRLGLISYSLYLWHWPLLVLARWTIGIHWYSIIILVPLTLLAAILSYSLIESPLRRSRWPASDQATMTVGLAAQLVTTGCLIAVANQSSNPLYTGAQAKRATDLASLSVSNTSINVRTCGGESIVALQQCVMQPKNNKPSIILLGDSHAGHLYPAMGAIRERTGIGIKTYNTAGNSHQPFPTISFGTGNAYLAGLPAKAAEINAFNAAIQRHIKKGDIMIIAFDWPRYFDIADPENDRHFKSWRSELHGLATTMSRRHAAVVVFAPFPRFHRGGGANCKREWFRPSIPESCKASIPYSEASKNSQALRGALQRLASEHENVKIFNPLPIFCDKIRNQCSNGNDDEIFFIDENHLSAQSDVIVGNGILAFLREQQLLDSNQ